MDKNSTGLFGNIRNINNISKIGVKNLTVSDAAVYLNDDGMDTCDCDGAIIAGFVLANPNLSVEFDNITA